MNLSNARSKNYSRKSSHCTLGLHGLYQTKRQKKTTDLRDKASFPKVIHHSNQAMNSRRTKDSKHAQKNDKKGDICEHRMGILHSLRCSRERSRKRGREDEASLAKLIPGFPNRNRMFVNHSGQDPSNSFLAKNPSANRLSALHSIPRIRIRERNKSSANQCLFF